MLNVRIEDVIMYIMSMSHLGEKLDHVPEHPAPGVQLGVELQQPGVLHGQHVVQRDVRVYAGLARSTWL